MKINNNKFNNKPYLSRKVGGQIRQARESQGITQVELAEMAQTKQPSIARLENGDTTPTLGSLTKISSCLGLWLDIKFEKLNNASVM